MDEVKEKVEFWGVVELFGHHQVAGRVSESEIAGAAFIRVDVPEVGDRPAHTKYYGPAAIYAMHPCTEEIARQAAARLRQWDAPLPVAVPDLTRAEDVLRRAEQARRALPAAVVDDHTGERVDPGYEDGLDMGEEEDDGRPF